MERRLVVCVDDAACDASVTRSVLALAAAGRITAASAMVGSPHWPVHAPALAAAPGIDLGLHLDLTEFPVAAPVRPLPRVLLRAYAAGRLGTGALRATIEAQLDRFERHAGRLPDHIDGHEHVQQLPGVREALLDAIQRRWSGRPTRPWLRIGRRPYRGRDAGKAWLIEALGARRLAALARNAGCPTNPALIGVYGFGGDASAHRARLDRWLAAAPDGALLMTHPAVGDDAPPRDPIARARRIEHDILAGTQWTALLQRHRVHLERGSRLY